MFKHRIRKYQFAAVAAVMAAVMLVGTALAHERIVKGDYAFVLGWVDEPPIVGLKNAALIELSTASDDKPVEGAEATLTAQIEFGGKTKELVLRPLEETPGSYAADFIPTRRGTYTLKIGGTLNGQPIDVSGEIEEVGSADSLAFPEPLGGDLQKAIDDVRGEVNSARTFGVAGAALGTIGLVLAGVALGRKRA
ncbi:MAG: hypothetical protein U0559_13065 [Anaerolineae bacterium]